MRRRLLLLCGLLVVGVALGAALGWWRDDDTTEATTSPPSTATGESSTTSPRTNASSTPSSTEAPVTETQPAVDDRVFVPEVRCGDGDVMLVGGRGTTVEVSICGGDDGGLTYRGLRYRDRAASELEACRVGDGRYRANLGATFYLVSVLDGEEAVIEIQSEDGTKLLTESLVLAAFTEPEVAAGC